MGVVKCGQLTIIMKETSPLRLLDLPLHLYSLYCMSINYSVVEDEDYWATRVKIVVDSTAAINSTYCTELEIDKLIVNDEVLESDETFELRAVFPERLIGSPDLLPITIQDDDGMKLLVSE